MNCNHVKSIPNSTISVKNYYNGIMNVKGYRPDTGCLAHAINRRVCATIVIMEIATTSAQSIQPKFHTISKLKSQIKQIGVNTTSKLKAIHVDTTASFNFFMALIANCYDERQIGFSSKPAYASRSAVYSGRFSCSSPPISISNTPANASINDAI
jgi:hypothetical protein